MYRLLTIGFCLLGASAAAQGNDCAKAVTQLELNQCAYDDWQAADADLNTAYQAAMRMAKDRDRDLPKGETGWSEALRDAQRAWITFRDKACEAEGYAMHGGSAEPLLVYGCLHSLTEERARQLTGLVDAYGDL
jgi:uncharacterized protein YecT (DUF1311 family)